MGVKLIKKQYNNFVENKHMDEKISLKITLKCVKITFNCMYLVIHVVAALKQC